ADDAERELPLQRSRPRLEHLEPLLAGTPAKLFEQARLADAGRSFEQDDTTVTGHDPGDGGVDGTELILAFDEILARGRGRGSWRTDSGRRDGGGRDRIRPVVGLRQQRAVERDELPTGDGAELLTQQATDLVVDLKCLSDVAARAERGDQRHPR